MADERWFPTAELRLIFRHVVTSIAVAAAMFITAKVFGLLGPEWADIADEIDGFVNLGILCVLGVKLLWAFTRSDNYHAFVAA
ncbi:MAG: hypothetical protein ACREQI_07615 [Candidatus Binataceae bacterium]